MQMLYVKLTNAITRQAAELARKENLPLCNMECEMLFMLANGGMHELGTTRASLIT